MRIAVTGGTGRVGGRVVRLLEGAGQHEAARVLTHHRTVLAAASECTVGHVVLLSGALSDVLAHR